MIIGVEGLRLSGNVDRIFSIILLLSECEKIFGFTKPLGGKNMLILTRRIGETLMIGDEITVTVLGIKGNQIRLGTNTPKSVSVHREEIYMRIQAEKDEPSSPGNEL